MTVVAALRWYVVVDDNCCDPKPDDLVWTISRFPDQPGWNTDSGFCGYGLTKDHAEELANAANRTRLFTKEELPLGKVMAIVKSEHEGTELGCILPDDGKSILSIIKTLKQAAVNYDYSKAEEARLKDK